MEKSMEKQQVCTFNLFLHGPPCSPCLRGKFVVVAINEPSEAEGRYLSEVEGRYLSEVEGRYLSEVEGRYLSEVEG
jgi:hypothetical protein